MPELPEVETTLRGISPHIHGQTVANTIIRQPKLRWRIPDDLAHTLAGQTVLECTRRAKYLLIRFATGIVLIHLGMSGSLRIFTAGDARISSPDKHDHVDIVFANGTVLRLHDPRRFGAVLWFAGAPEHHPLLAALGPEPLSPQFNADYLYEKLRKQKRAAKLALMDNAVVVGVGNIYASEALFLAGIRPTTRASLLSGPRVKKLHHAIRDVLLQAVAAGGSTLRDFTSAQGKSGHFQLDAMVYGRTGQACRRCSTAIKIIRQGQRSSFYCPVCQKI